MIKEDKTRWASLLDPVALVMDWGLLYNKLRFEM